MIRKSKYFFLKQYEVTKKAVSNIKSTDINGIKVNYCPYCIKEPPTNTNIESFSNIGVNINNVIDHMAICQLNPAFLKEKKYNKNNYLKLLKTLKIDKNKLSEEKIIIGKGFLHPVASKPDSKVSRFVNVTYENAKYYLGDIIANLPYNDKIVSWDSIILPKIEGNTRDITQEETDLYWDKLMQKISIMNNTK